MSREGWVFWLCVALMVLGGILLAAALSGPVSLRELAGLIGAWLLVAGAFLSAISTVDRSRR